MMSSLANLPIELLQDNLLPFLPAKDLLNLTRVNKFFSVVCSDDTVWKRKLAVDFNYTGEGTARTTGWKVIYRGLHNPKVYVWGERANGRLGAVKLPASSVAGIPFPFQLNIPRARIVRLIAGGTSFHALDSEGNIHVWGTLAGDAYALDRTGFSDPSARALTPHRLLMPSPIRNISCGRFHSSAMDSQNRIWTFVNWGRPFSIDSPVLRDPVSPPIQVECGWGFTSVLTATGDVFVWWPFSHPLAQIIQEKNAAFDSDPEKRVVATKDMEIPCATFTVDSLSLTRLPALPSLPPLERTGVEANSPLPQLIQIAGLEGYLIGLTNHGHVLKFGKLDDADAARSGQWDYLPQFSDIDLIRQNKTFKGDDDNKSAAPDVMKITHITASFRQFFAYSTGSSSLVISGTNDTGPETEPEIKPELQNRSVISVAVGDWHNAALTSDGKVLTWGEFSSGALGLGDPGKLEPGTPGGYQSSTANQGRRRRVPPAVEAPTPVRFDHGAKSPRDRFAFAITASGWHTGALVMDLDPNGDEEDVYEMEDDEEPVQHSNVPLDPHTYESPPIIPQHGPFRIGIVQQRGIVGRGRGRGA